MWGDIGFVSVAPGQGPRHLSLSGLFSNLPGPQKFHGRVVILVNQHTTSAGEMIAGFAKENNFATIVGTTTAGRLLSGSVFKVGHS